MSVDPQTLSNLIMGLTAWGAAFLVALWLSLIFWSYRDIRQRARDPFIRILAVIIVALLFLPGVVIYLILRPAHTIEEEYQHSLEEEALLQTIEDPTTCPGCGRRIQETWIVCPSCHTRLKKSCPQCHKPMELAWNLCPYCGTPAAGMKRENISGKDLTRLDAAEDEVLLGKILSAEEPLNKEQ